MTEEQNQTQNIPAAQIKNKAPMIPLEDVIVAPYKKIKYLFKPLLKFFAVFIGIIIGYLAIFAGLALAISPSFFQKDAISTSKSGAFLIILLIIFAIGIIILACLMQIGLLVIIKNNNNKIAFKEIISEAKKYFWRYIVISLIIFGIIIGLFFVFGGFGLLSFYLISKSKIFIILAFLLGILFVLSFLIIGLLLPFVFWALFQEGYSKMAAFNRARDLIKNYFWETIGRILLLILIMWGVLFVIQFACQFIMGFGMGLMSVFAEKGNYIIVFIFIPIAIIIWLFMYLIQLFSQAYMFSGYNILYLNLVSLKDKKEDETNKMYFSPKIIETSPTTAPKSSKKWMIGCGIGCAILAIIIIVGLFSTLAIVSLNSAREKARDAKRTSDIGQIQTALELYKIDNEKYPENLELLKKPDLLPAIPTDPNINGTGSYKYIYMDNDNYQLCFTMEDGNAKYKAGDNCVGPQSFNLPETPTTSSLINSVQ